MPFTPPYSPPPKSKFLLVEIRLPTYKRTDLLKRALESILQQTYEHWNAYVLDDDPDKSARELVSKMSDPRIHYCSNEQNLKASGNLNLAFSPLPNNPKSQFACVLEDDNYFLPTLLEENIQALKQGSHSILMRNLFYGKLLRNGTFIQQDDKVWSHRYGDKPRTLSYKERVRACFCCTGISNLGIFWKLNSGLDLRVNVPLLDSLNQEIYRGLMIKQDMRYESKPLSVFTVFEERSDILWVVNDKTEHNRRVKRNEIATTSLLLKISSKEDVEWALKNHHNKPALLERLAAAGHLKSILRMHNFKALIRILKGWLLCIAYKSPYEKKHQEIV